MDSEIDNFDFQTIDRFVNVLSSGRPKDKTAALKELIKMVDEAGSDLTFEIHDKIQNQLILRFQDSSETVRENALVLSRRMIEKLDVDTSRICLLIPALYPRVCLEKDHESSEELRLIIGELLAVITEKYGHELAPYTMEMVDMVCRLLNDPSPDIKQTSSRLVVILVKVLPQETHGYTKKLWPPLVVNLDHRRWRVRVSSVEAIEALMLTGDNKLVSEVTPALNKKMLDPMHQVRLSLVKLSGRWMLELPDRYSFFAHLIPIMLSGLADQNDEVRCIARELWDQAGDKYLKENDTDFKDKINYEPQFLDHYPSGIQRPNLGCRILIEREATKFLLALVNELTDWVEIVRIKASTLLIQVVLHFETSITMSIRKIIAPICKAAQDKETPVVVSNVKSAAEIMGYFIPPSTYCKLIVDYMKEAKEGELLVVAALIRGSLRGELVEHLPAVATLMETPTFKGSEQLALLDLIQSIVNTSQSDCLTIGNHIWGCLISIAGLAVSENIRDEAVRLLADFAQLGGGDKRQVFGQFCSPLLSKLTGTVWTVHCQEQFILKAMIDCAGEVVCDNLDAVIEIIGAGLKPDNDPEVLLKVAMSVNELMSKPEVTLPTDEALSKFLQAALTDMLPPLLKWSPGRSAEAVRTIATTCLYMCLSKVGCKKDTSGKEVCNIDVYVEPLLPLILSLIEDPAPKTRILALNCVKLLAYSTATHETRHYSTLIPQLVKRLDDADTKVRLTSVGVLKICYERHIVEAIPEEINRTLVDFVYSTLLIHLDDKDNQLKQAVFECLQIVGGIDPSSLHKKISPLHFRDRDICQQLLNFVEDKMRSIAIQ